MIKVSNNNRHIILESILMWAQEEIQRPFSDRVDHYGCVTIQPWYSGASSSLGIVMPPSTTVAL